MSNKVYVHCPACGFGFVHMVENSGKAAGGTGKGSCATPPAGNFAGSRPGSS